jgi:hypothetical protein
MKLFFKISFFICSMVITVGEVKSSTITDLGANRLTGATVTAKMTDHQRIMSNPVVQNMHKAQGEFWDNPATQVVLGLLPIGGVAEGISWAGRGAKALFSGSKAAKVAKTGGNLVEQVAVHGNSLKSTKPTWGYKLYSNDGTFLKNGITSQPNPLNRYTREFMKTHKMEPIELFPNRRAAYMWEYNENLINRGPLNFNMH